MNTNFETVPERGVHAASTHGHQKRADIEAG
jgi:hypothetical protein